MAVEGNEVRRVAPPYWIRTSFNGEVCPLLMTTDDFVQPKCFATTSINSWFAFPSTGGDLSRANHVPSVCSPKEHVFEPGFTFTWMIFTDRSVLE